MKVSPWRARRTQYGPSISGTVVSWDSAPAARRRWKLAPSYGVTAIIAWAESSVSVSRIITPALAHSWVSWTLTTRAMISPSPVIGQ